MDDCAHGETVQLPDLRDIEVKIGRKIPEGLIKCMRDEASSTKTDGKLQSAASESAPADRQTDSEGLDEKIRTLKIDMALLRSLDVKILQQLLALHESMEAMRWLAEERSTLTSRCSSLTSSQYSLGEGPDTSWRGSWSSLHDPNDKLDNISIGSYLDTLADDMDEYGHSSESVHCSSAALRSLGHEAAPAGGRTCGGDPGTVEGPGFGAANGGSDASPAPANDSNGGPAAPGAERVAEDTAGGMAGSAAGGVAGSAAGGVAGSGAGGVQAPAAIVGSRSLATGKKTPAAGPPKEEAVILTKTKELGKKDPFGKDKGQARHVKNKGTLEKSAKKTNGSDPIQPCLSDKLGKSHSPKFKAFPNGKKDLDSCKMNGKLRLEYDAHWRWVQSQDDVTFL